MQDWKDKKVIYINKNIKAFNIMLLGDDGEQLWTIPRGEALRKAEDEWVDLVQVWYNFKEKISICKIMDYWKFQYMQKKQDREKRKNQKNKWVKEIKLSYAIWENDLKLKIDKTIELLKEWYTIKCMLKLRWRENIFKYESKNIVKSFIEEISENWKSWMIKDEWRWYSVILFPKVK